MKRVTIIHSSGRSISVSPAQARAYVAKGWQRADDAQMAGVATLIDPHESILAADDEGDTERYERITPRFDFETDI